MKYVPAILLFALCYGCNDTIPTVKINSAQIQTRPNHFSFKLDYLGNGNARFAGISYTDSLHVYKLKSIRIDEYENFIIGVLDKNYPYTIDSSADGGNSWAVTSLLAQLKYTSSTVNPERIVGFFVSKGGHHKYIITTECLYYSVNNGSFQQFRIDNKGKSCFYDRNRDMILIFGPKLPNAFPINFSLKGSSGKKNPVSLYQDETGNISYFQFSNLKTPPDTSFAGPILRTLQLREIEEYQTFRVFYPEKFFPQYKMTLSLQERLKGDTSTPGINYFTSEGKHGFFSDSIFNLSKNHRLYLSNTSSEIILICADGNYESLSSEAYHATPVLSSALSTLQLYTIHEQPQMINISIGIKKGSIGSTRINLKLFAASMHSDTNFHQLIPLDIPFTPNADSTVWEGNFWPGKLKLQKGDQYKIMIWFSDHTKEERYFIEREFVPESFITRYRQWIVLAVVFIGYLLIIVLIWYFFPLKLLSIYTKLKLKEWLKLTNEPFNTLFTVIQLLFPLSLFVNTRRVYNAWMSKYSNSINGQFSRLHAVKARSSYIPVPLLYQPAGEASAIPENHLDALPPALTAHKRQLIQIIGEGGIGKTTLGIQLSRWLIHSGNHKKASRSVIMIDTATADLVTTIAEKFVLWLPNESVSPSFIQGLLKNKNLIIFVDALSEGSNTMQNYINHIHSRLPVNTMIITSRVAFSMQELPCTFFYPQSLDTQSLLFFVNSYIERPRDFSTDRETYLISKLTEQQKLNFTAKVISIIQDNIEHRISPAQVKIIIDYFLRSFDPATPFEKFLNDMPENIQEIYYYYLASTNPINKDAPNYLHHEYLIKVIELLGSMSLQGNYIPKDVEKGMARKQIKEELPHIEGDALQRLIDNNIIYEKERLGTYWLRFNLDSIAEVTAAKYFYLKHQQAGDLDEFFQLIDNLVHANGFKVAFLRVLATMSTQE